MSLSSTEAPESYLAILPSSSEQYYDDLFDSFKKFNSDERQKLELLDALAEICVSQGEGEAYASAIETGPETCTLFIVGNHEEVPQVTQDYLTDICSRLTDVAHVVDTEGLYKPSIHDLSLRTQESINDIHISILLFTYEKFLARLTKWNGPWLKRGADIDHRLGDGAEKNKFQELKNSLSVLHQLATCHTRDVMTLHQVLSAISRSWKLSNPDTVAFLRRLDVLPRSDQTDVPFSIEQYLRKVLKTHNETTKLICFAVSPRRGHIFRNQPKFVFLRSERRCVELDVKTAVRTLERHMDTTEQDRVHLDRFINNEGDDQYTCCAHCECAMMVELLKRRGTQQRPAPIIGVSKLSCFTCHLFFVAYNQARIRLTETDLPSEFVITGAHNTLYLPWVSPDLTSIDPKLHAGIQQHLLEVAREAAVAHVRSLRRYSGSTPYWAEDSEVEVMKVNMSLEDILRNWKAKMNISS
ncbi:hypothetical protein ARMSODRAFT_955242 [Armillaria solidipes]|uniref:Uncharacterized protein n=1 Tax=Armillaria solidipes TaxID=1076256 RepID=A0A2H3BKU0_9AGAR|nr:hypothetical protein ARMSODRAFT_955242 [Armillaria solidipes]